jgi:Polyketide cyclase / dehydrase and lipid transport
MSMTFREAALETTASPDRVWWSDVNSWPEWNPDMKESRLDGPLRIGTRGMINTRSGGKHEVVVTQFEDGKTFELESTALPMTRMAIRATVTPAGSGTRMSQGFEARGVLAPIVGPLMGGTILKTFSSVLAGLARRVETS